MKSKLPVLFLLLSFRTTAIKCDAIPFWEMPSKNAHKILKQMTLKEKIGQLFMLGISSYDQEVDKQLVEKLTKEYNLGGYMFMYGSVKKQVGLVNHYQKIAKTPLLFSQDNEWGRVQRLPELTKYPDSMTLGSLDNIEHLYSVGSVYGKRCKNLGILLNFAPILDVNNNPLNPVINDRSFGDDKESVSQKGIATIKGMQTQGVMACAKHFPGHGDTSVDSHLGLPSVNKSEEEFNNLELYPFKQAIKNGVQAIMTAHIVFPQIDPNVPATLSRKILTEILREQLGFEGLLVTDAMNMNAIAKKYPLEEAALMALKAGNDIILFAKAKPDPKKRESEITGSIERIYQAVTDGEITESEIDEHVLRILQAKEWAGLFENRLINSKTTSETINSDQVKKLKTQLYEEAITMVANNQFLIPLSTLESEATAYVQIGNTSETPFFNQLKKYRDMDTFLEKQTPSNLLNKLEDYEVVIVGLYSMSRFAAKNWNISKETQNLLYELRQRGKDIVLIIFGSPYSLKIFKDLDTTIVAYEEDPEAQIAAAKVIGGDLIPKGKLPINS